MLALALILAAGIAKGQTTIVLGILSGKVITYSVVVR
jgi:hypothetical protein